MTCAQYDIINIKYVLMHKRGSTVNFHICYKYYWKNGVNNFALKNMVMKQKAFLKNIYLDDFFDRRYPPKWP